MKTNMTGKTVRFMVFNGISNSISVILVEETWIPPPHENHQPVASHWKTLS